VYLTLAEVDKLQSKLLLSLSQIDQRIVILKSEKDEIDNRRAVKRAEIDRLRKLVSETETKQKECSTRQTLEEHRLREEERKVVERRRQLTALGGAKAAKLVEREIDIASKAVAQLEERLLRAIEDSDKTETQLNAHRSELAALESQFEAEHSGSEERAAQLAADINDYGAERDELVGQLDSRPRELYLRVRSKYPAGAVALAENGSCRSCYRSLPSQIFNQVIAATALIQCPGCSRILVSLASTPE
jgi:predicted  nucleic acid-binding Zn-ribbon protein